MKDIVVIASASGAAAGSIAQLLGVVGLRSLLVFHADQVVRSVGSQTCLLLLDEAAVPAPARDAALARARTDGVPVLVLTDTNAEPPSRPDPLTPDDGPVPVPRSAPPGEIALNAVRLSRTERLSGFAGMAAREFSFGDLTLDLEAHEVRWAGRTLPTTPQQRRLLRALLETRGSVVSDRDLARAMYGSSVGDDEARVHAHVKRLRKAFAAMDPARRGPIERVRGAGYRLLNEDAVLEGSEGVSGGTAGGRPAGR